MKFITYRHKDKKHVGYISGRKAFPLPFKDMNELIEKYDNTVTSGEGVELSEVEILAPIEEPKQDVICLGINFTEHAEESARFEGVAFGGERPYAVYFSKRVNECLKTGGVLSSYSDVTDSLDYECELAVIIGKRADKVKREDAYDYVFGYTIMNDISARNYQTRYKQWYLGKSFNNFTPLGPCIVTEDEFKRPPSLKLSSYVNGELRQCSNTDKLIFDIPHVIEELSRVMTLKPATVIAMGTPSGVGMGFEPPRFLKCGDTVKCEIENIGELITNIGE